MKKLFNVLPMLAFVLAGIAGMAFTSATDLDDPKFGKFNGDWYDVTGMTEGPTTYQCLQSSAVCLREQPNDQAAIVQNNATFVLHADIDPVD